MIGRDVSQLSEDVYNTEQADLAGVDTDKQVINSSGVVATAGSTNYHVVTFDVTSLQGQSVIVTANTNWGNCLYAIYDVNNNLLSKSSIAPSSGSKYGIIDEEIVLPFNAITLYVAYNITWEQASVKYNRKLSKIEELENIVDAIPTEDIYVEKVENTVSNKYISPNGTITDGGAAYTISNNVVVISGQSILITASSNWGNALYAFYASDNTVIQVGPLATSSATVTEINESPITVPDNAAYIIVARNLNSRNPISVKLKDGIQLKKRFSGKKWVVVGDSLTEHNSRTLKNYHDFVAESTGISVVNMGVSGSGYMRLSESNKAFYQRVTSIPTDADVITIFGSGNDLGVSPYNLGEPSDTGTTTICGCINTTLDNILSLFLAANKVPVVGVITPTPWANNEPSTTTGRMPAYAAAIIECCKRKSIPVLDLYHESNLHPDNSEFRSLAYSRDDGNGVHPDERGHEIIAPMFQSFLQSLLLYV